MNYAAQERFSDSVVAYQEAGRLNPDLAPLVTQSVDLVKHLQRAKERPDDPAVQAQLGEIYASDGRPDRPLGPPVPSPFTGVLYSANRGEPQVRRYA